MGKYTKEIIAYSLKSKIEFGNVDSGKVLTKLFQHGLKKEEIKEVMEEIKQETEKINSMEKDKAEELFKDFSKFLKEREERYGLPELPNASKKMVFRLAPFPSGALHIGNAKTYLLNALYAEKYNGKIILVMDDTIGSEEKPIHLESYKLIEDAFKWLGVKYEKKVVYKSDRLELYYKYALELIKKETAYVCHCRQEVLRENRAKGLECGCRHLPVDIQLGRWKEMFNQHEGDAVLRIKTGMQNPNPAFRDRVLFRIAEREHPRVGKKYKVWPTLEMTWAIDDYELGITHIIRGNDLMIETDMEKFIWDIFGWKHPETIHTGLVRIEGLGAKISKSKAQKEVKSGEFSGWDDPRTWSIQSLKRRGILPEAIRKFVEEIGLNKQDINVPIDSLYSINRKMIDLDSDRYYFISNPVKLEIVNKPEIEVVDLPMHPDKKGYREVKVGDIWIDGRDFDELKGKEARLLHLYNVNLGEKARITGLENKSIGRIQWVSEYVHSKILMADGSFIQGFAESGVKKLKRGEIIQFERFGFARFDGIKNEGGKEVYEFWFAHK